MQNALPIIPWLGGKRRLADKLIPLFPAHECYVEVFCGGAELYFLRPPAPVEVLNDINGDLVNLYRVVQHHLEEFVRQFKWAISSRQVFEWQQDTKPATLTDIQRAARFYYLQHHAFGGRVSGQTFGTATTAPTINLCRIEESLSAAHLRLAGTTVENLPWQEVLRRYDRPHTFFYLDPPYWPDIRQAFDGLTMRDLGIKYSVANNHGQPTESRELVITNYEPGVMGGLF
jgi:DNA adenine methylase